MAKITELKERTTNETLYPVTITEAILDKNGIDLETKLNGTTYTEVTLENIQDIEIGDRIEDEIHGIYGKVIAIEQLENSITIVGICDNSYTTHTEDLQEGNDYLLQFSYWTDLNEQTGVEWDITKVITERYIDNLVENGNISTIVNSLHTSVGTTNGQAGTILQNKNTEHNNYNNHIVLSKKDNNLLYCELNTDNTIDIKVASNNNETDILGQLVTSNDLENKANTSDLSNVLADSVVNSENFPDIDNITREDLKKDLFIDMWNEACGTFGTYNINTGYFELNGLIDITYEQALNIYRITSGNYINDNAISLYNQQYIRTNIPSNQSPSVNLTKTFAYCWNLEVAKLNDYYSRNITIVNNLSATFLYCRKLRIVEGILKYNGLNVLNDSCFWLCEKLEKVFIKGLGNNISFQHSPNLSYESIRYLVDNTSNISHITVTVHPDVYAKLTGDTSSSAVTNITTEELAQWQQILTDAAAKNITFITV